MANFILFFIFTLSMPNELVYVYSQPALDVETDSWGSNQSASSEGEIVESMVFHEGGSEDQ